MVMMILTLAVGLQRAAASPTWLSGGGGSSAGERRTATLTGEKHVETVERGKVKGQRTTAVQRFYVLNASHQRIHV